MKLLTTYLPSLKGFAYHLTKNWADAEDLLQDVALKMITAGVCNKPYDEQTKICYRALINASKDRYLTKKRDLERKRKYYHPQLYVMPVAMGNMELKEVLAQMRHINPKFRRPLLACAAGYTMREINNNTNIAVGKIRYGRLALAKLMAEQTS